MPVTTQWRRSYAGTPRRTLRQTAAYQTGALATDVCALEEILHGDSKSILIGHDWGAFASYGAAGMRPDRFEKVVAMAAAACPGDRFDISSRTTR